MTMSLTVVCLFVKGEYPYTAEYVERLYAGVRKHLARPFRFVCLTDQPWLFQPPIETIPVHALKTRHTFWTKLRLFDPALGLTGRILYLDLDTLVVGDLSPIVDYPARYAWAADALAPSLDGPPVRGLKGGRVWLPRVQGSVSVWDGGLLHSLWAEFRLWHADRYYTDQDWIGEQYPDAPVMPVEWFPRLNMTKTGPGIVQAPPWPSEAKVILCKKSKNHRLAADYPWFAEAWRAA